MPYTGLQKDYMGGGLAAALPAPTVLGPTIPPGSCAFYFATNTNVLYRLAGGDVAWQVAAGGGGGNSISRRTLAAMRPLSDFTQIDVAGARTITNAAGLALTLRDSSPGTAFKIWGLARPLPVAPYKIFIRAEANHQEINYLGICWGFADGATTGANFHIATTSADHTLDIQTWAGNGTRTGFTVVSGNVPDHGTWLTLENDLTNITWGISKDGVYSGGRRLVLPDGFLTPTHAFVGLINLGSGGANGALYDYSMSIFEWDENGLTRTFT